MPTNRSRWPVRWAGPLLGAALVFAGACDVPDELSAGSGSDDTSVTDAGSPEAGDLVPAGERPGSPATSAGGPDEGDSDDGYTPPASTGPDEPDEPVREATQGSAALDVFARLADYARQHAEPGSDLSPATDPAEGFVIDLDVTPGGPGPAPTATPRPTTPPPPAPPTSTPPPTAAPPPPPPTATPAPPPPLPTATPAPPPPPPPPPPSGDSAALEAQMVQMVNNLRATVGAPPLASNAALAGVARNWSARLDWPSAFYHNPNVGSQIPPGWSTWGENLAVAPSIESAFNALVNSPGHYANMTNPTFNSIGIGVVIKNGSVYVTQVFAAY